MAQRRVNGEGTIYRRKDGRYEAAAYLLTTSGKRQRVRLYASTRQEAQNKLVNAKANSQQGIPIPEKSWKLRDYLDYWLEHAVRIKRRPLTYRRDEAIVRLHLKPGLGQYALNSLSVQIVQDFLDQLYSDGRSAATLFQIRKVLSAALTYAMRKELLFRNVARLVELPSYKPDEASHWNLGETLQFLQAAQSDPLYPAFALLVLYGLRRGEVLGLRWCDVDFEQGILHVRQQLQRIDGELRQVPLKTEASNRDEPLLTTARDVLIEQRRKQAAARASATEDWQGVGTEKELVFTTRTGRPIESHNLYRSFMRICAQHNIRRITVHGMRHTNATTQKNLHVHARDIQAILGHGDVRTTGIYEHVDLDNKRNALVKVEQQLFGRESTGDRWRSRQPLPSNNLFVADITSSKSGGASQTRTGDTRLFRPTDASMQERLTSIVFVMQGRTRVWMLGCVAVDVAVRY